MIAVGMILDRIGAVARSRAVADRSAIPGWRVTTDYSYEPLELRSAQPRDLPVNVGHDWSRLIQELPQGHRVPGAREARQPLADRVVQRERAAGDERERRRAVVGLGHAGDPHGQRRARRRGGSDSRHAGRVDRDLVAALDDRDGAGRAAPGRDERVEAAIER